MPEPDPSPEFLANVWRRIDENRSLIWTAFVQMWAPRIVAVSILAAAVLSTFVWISQEREVQETVLNHGYIEALTVDSLDEHDGALWIMAGDRLAAKR